MKIKNLTKSIVAVILGATVSVSAFAMVGCDDDKDGPGPGPIIVDPAKVEITVDKDVMKVEDNDSVKLSANVTQYAEKGVIWTISGDGASYVYFDQATSSVKFYDYETLKPQFDTTITVTATSVVSAAVKSSVIITLRAIYKDEFVDELSSDMIRALGNENITVSGTVEDVVESLVDESKSVNEYDYKVMMSEGAWYGEWNRHGSSDKETYNYRIGDEVEGTSFHTFNEVYVNQYNKADLKLVTDYESFPVYWEKNHLYNHISLLANDIRKRWEHDAKADIYVYQPDEEMRETENGTLDYSLDRYLRTYLAHSLTPMLENETFAQMVLYLEKNEDGEKYISKMVARTDTVYYGGESETSDKGATSMEYTQVTLNFSDVGTTAVPEAKPYTLDESNPINAQASELRVKALKNMGDATNYTFRAVENTIQAPDYDEGDYEIESLSSTYIGNNTAATGTEGLVGYVTKDTILLARTGKYNSSMDGNLYWTDYSGYVQRGENYDFFEWNSASKAFEGQRQYSGNLFDRMPKFDFAPEIFKMESFSGNTEGGKTVIDYHFVLREPAITRDIAMEMSMHSYADDALGSTWGTLKITVRAPEGGEPYVYATEYPYSVSGNYLGVIQTTYSKIGSTTIEKNAFDIDTYVERKVPQDWSGYNVKYYHPDHSTIGASEETDAETLLKQIYGNGAELPQPTRFQKVFGDGILGPFFDWEEKTDATTNEKTYRDYISITVTLDERDCDENGRITDKQHSDAINALATELAKDGYYVDTANTGDTGWGDKYTVFVNNSSKIMIRIHNNRTRFFFIDIMPAGMWTFNY